MLFGSATPPEPMGQFTGFLLNWVAGQSRSAFTVALERLGLKPQHFAAMAMIEALPGLAQQDLVSATHIDPSTMVALLDELEVAGLAERRPHPSDRRKRSLYLTAAGQAKMDVARPAAAAAGTEVFGVLEPAELAEMHRLLRKAAGFVD